jgi:hypothetical protein
MIAKHPKGDDIYLVSTVSSWYDREESPAFGGPNDY